MTLKRVLFLLGGVAGLMAVFGIIAGFHELAEICRVINVPLGITIAAGFFIRVNDAWHRYGVGGRVVRVGILLVLLVVAAGSAEAFVTHAQLGLRSAVMTFALLVTGVGLLLIPHDDV